MSLKIPTKYLFLALLIAFAGVLCLGWYIGYKRTESALKPQITTLSTQLRQKTLKIDGQEFYISVVDQQLATEREMKKVFEVTNSDLKKMNIKQANEISRLKLRIDTLLTDVSHNGKIISVLTEKIDSLSHDTITVKENAIILPFEFVWPLRDKLDKWLNLNGVFNNEGKLDIDLQMKLDVDVLTGIDKEKNPICILKTDNPYIKSLGISSFKTDTPKKRYYGIGLIGGYGISFGNPLRSSPFLGVGLSYNFIRF